MQRFRRPCCCRGAAAAAQAEESKSCCSAAERRAEVLQWCSEAWGSAGSGPSVPRVRLWSCAAVLRGGSDVELRTALEKVGVMEAKVLKFGQVGDGAIGGLESETFGKEFQRNIATHLLGGWSATW